MNGASRSSVGWHSCQFVLICSIAEAWVTVEGTVAILDEGGRELACRLAAIYYEPDLAKETIAIWEKLEDWVLLELTPTRIRSFR